MKIILVMCGVVSLVLVGIFGVSPIASIGVPKNNTETMEGVDDNKCWFLTSKGHDTVSTKIMEARQNREIFGYPNDLPISEALRIFNEEQKCSKNFISELTEDEILSAVALPLDYGSESNWPFQKDILRSVLVTRKLPKGSLLVNEGGGIYQSQITGSNGEITVKGQRIYLFLHLHENPRASQELKDEQIFLIKKALFGVEGI